MATAMATAMLKMDENVNLPLQRHVNRALFCCLRLFFWHRFVYFSNIGERVTGNANDNFKLVTITQFTKLE